MSLFFLSSVLILFGQLKPLCVKLVGGIGKGFVIKGEGEPGFDKSCVIPIVHLYPLQWIHKTTRNKFLVSSVHTT